MDIGSELCGYLRCVGGEEGLTALPQERFNKLNGLELTHPGGREQRERVLERSVGLFYGEGIRHVVCGSGSSTVAKLSPTWKQRSEDQCRIGTRSDGHRLHVSLLTSATRAVFQSILALSTWAIPD